MSRLSFFAVLLKTSIVLYLYLKSSQAQCPLCTNNMVQVTTTSISVSCNCTVSTGNQSAVFNSTVAILTGLSPGYPYTLNIQCNATTCSRNVTTQPGAITILTVTEFTTSSVSLNWIQPEGISSFYKVDWTGGSLNGSRNTTTTSLNITGLIAGVQYIFTVTAVAADNTTQGQSKTVTLYSKPGAITILTVTEFTTSSVSLNWTQPEGNNSFYKVDWTGGNFNGSQNTTTASFNVTGLIAGVQYIFTVTAVAADNTTQGQSNTVTQYTKPAAIKNFNVAGFTTSSVTLNWTPPEGNSSFYKVDYTGSVNGSTNTTLTSVNITGLTAGFQYIFTVRAVTGDNATVGAASTIAAFTSPEKPVNITATAQEIRLLNVSWTLPGGRVDYYNVSIWNPALNKTLNQINQTAASFTSLSPGQLYAVTVTSVAGSLSNQSATVQFASAPTKPVPLNITERTTSSIVVQWATPAEMTYATNISYNISYQSNGTGSQFLNIPDLRYNLTSLISGANYTIGVKTVGPQNLGSEPVYTTAYTLPMSVLSLTARPSSSYSVNLQWMAPLEYKSYYSYIIKYRNVQNSTSSTSLVINGLQPGTGYNFTVITLAAPGSEATPVLAFSYTIPKEPTGIVAIGTTTTMTVSWNAPAGLVELYYVIISNTSVTLNQTVNSTTVGFWNLTPGTLYAISVASISGLLSSSAQNISNATYPNPPGNITVASQNNTTINITWTPPTGMYQVQYNFSVSIGSSQYQTGNSWFWFDKLQSGTPYNIIVLTVGALNYTSTPMTTQVYTRPNSVSELVEAGITPTSVFLVWTQPDYKAGYSFKVDVMFSNGPLVTLITSNKNVSINELQSGSNYSFTVTTLTADNTSSTPVTVFYFTRPYPISGLVATTWNTTAVNLSWNKPSQNKSGYMYRILIQGCTTYPRNQTSAVEMAIIVQLLPGTNCTFSVSVQAPNGIEGDAASCSQYTKPESVVLSISSYGNSTIMVNWTVPQGNVETYVVNLSDNKTSYTFNLTSAWQYNFQNLSAGRAYTATVTTVSGPFNNPSVPVTTATYPNPPGNIEILGFTTTSISVGWAAAPMMDNKTVYIVTSTQPKNQTINTTNISQILTNLISGTPYNVTVATVGDLGFQSQEVRMISCTTMPESVKSLTQQAEEQSVTLYWDLPEEYKLSYIFVVNGTSFSSIVIGSNITICKLDPGSPYNYTVTTVTADRTQGVSVWISNCTTASPVSNLTCTPTDGLSPTLILSWIQPRGQNQGFQISAAETNSTPVVHNVMTSGLIVPVEKYYTSYSLNITTLGCGKSSTVQTYPCKSGIGAPPPPNTENLVTTKDVTSSTFNIQLNPSILNGSNGPVTQWGVLITLDISSVNQSNSGPYLVKTYDDWKKDSAVKTYLSAVQNISSVNRAENSVITIGDNSVWKKYVNGPLDPNNKYSYAVVLFTKPVTQNELLNFSSSLFSVTWCSSCQVFLPLSQASVIGLAVGASLGIVAVLFLIAGIIYIRRNTVKKETSDIPIQSMRAKVNIAVTVEDYEAYYKKQRADSNCGFAEEFEDLKPVGTAQARTSALALENKPKNRYNNVLPYDSSRVKLSIQGSPFDDYINSNYIPGYNSRKEFIAAQGPLPCTVNEFWRMIWEKNVLTLVMLTRCNEQGRVKCEKYWPSETKSFGHITVTTTSDIPLEDWTIRDFQIKNVKTAETRSVRHFHFTAWPDHGVPETTELLINFRHLVREHMDQYSRHSPTVVHCSAGVGRTGTFIAIDRLIFQIESESVVDVYGIIHDQRMHRPLMVQTEDQYVFLNQCAMDIIRSRNGTNVDLIYQNTDALGIYENVEPRNKTKNGYRNP